MYRKTIFAGILLLSITLAACSPTPSSAPEENGVSAKGPDATFVWTSDTACSPCHATQEASLTDVSCVASLHADVQCVVCHAETETLETAHANVTYENTEVAKKLKKTTIDESSCVNNVCHKPESLASATSESTVLTDENGTVVNPHLVKTDHNENGQHSDIVCTDCHFIHESKGAVVAANSTCNSCHHAQVYECGTCHD